MSASQRAQIQREMVASCVLGILARTPDAVPQINIDDLCSETGLGRNTVYGLFGSASRIVPETLEGALAQFLAAALGDEAEATPLGALERAAARWVGAALQNVAVAQLLLRWQRPALAAAVAESLRRLLARGIAAGAFAPDTLPQRLPYVADVYLVALSEANAPGASQRVLARTLFDASLRLAR
ncbi:MAG TPA: hypothetical protein VHM70_02105 [Polyangiaceae bacterium]|nr:hypothetical protein [Polyangiaceae bacterium]